MRIDKDPTVLLDLVRLDLDAALVLLVHRLLELFAQLVHHGVDVPAALCRGDRVDERYVLEAFFEIKKSNGF